MDSGQIILFQTQGGETKIEVRLANESVCVSPLIIYHKFNHPIN